MTLIRRYNTLFKASVCIKDSLFFMPNLYKNYIVYSYCTTKPCMHGFNIKNIRYFSDNINTDDEQNFLSKLVILNRDFNEKYINLDLLMSIIKDLEDNDYDISHTLSIMLLQCCGNVLYDKPLKKRQEVTNHVWNLLNKRKYRFTINHYHALLQAYIDNDQAINPGEFLKSMTLVPEYNTYCLLLEVPCTDNGVFAGILESKLKDNTLPIGQKICNSLAYAYGVCGDAEGVMRIEALMDEKNIKQSSIIDTYLLYAFAKNGDIQMLTKTSENINLTTSHMINIIKHLSLSGNGKYIPNILEKVQLLIEEKDIIAFIVQLVHAGQVSDAYQIIDHISINSTLPDIRKTLMFYFLKEIIKLKEDPNNMLQFISNFAKKYSDLDIWEKAVKLVLEEKNRSLAFKIFDKMKATGITPKSHHFWPLLLYAQKEQNELHIYEVMKYMSILDVKIDSETFITYILPYIDTSDPVSTIIKMQSYNMASCHIVEPFVKFLLDAGRVTESIVICSVFKKKIDCQMILDSLYLVYKKSYDISTCIEFLFKLTYNGSGFVARFIKKLLDESQITVKDIESFLKFLTECKQYNVVISSADAMYIKDKILNMNVAKDLKENMLHIFGTTTNTKSNKKENLNTKNFVHPEYMNFDQLHSHYHELEQKNKNTRGVLRRLLIAACHNNDVKLVTNLIADMHNNNFNWTAAMKLNLFDFYTKNKMIEEASSTFCEIQAQFPNVTFDNFKILRYALVLVENDKVNEALNVIGNCTSINQKPDAHTQVHNLVSLLIKKNYSDDAEKMITLLLERGYYNNKYYAYRHLILAQMSKGNTESAVNLFANCVANLCKTPAKQEILQELVKLTTTSPTSKYQNLLHKVYELITNVHGKSIANINLMVSLALCNKIYDLQQLLKINKIEVHLILQQFQYLKDEEVIKTTLAILEASENSPTLCLDSICDAAVLICDKQGDSKVAMELEKKMKSKNVKPSKVFQNTFKKLLEIDKFLATSHTITNTNNETKESVKNYNS